MERDNIIKNGYVAHFDMLGFSSIVRQKPEKAWITLNKLCDNSDKLIVPVKIQSTNNTIADVKSVYFSDTIVIYTQRNKKIWNDRRRDCKGCHEPITAYERAGGG